MRSISDFSPDRPLIAIKRKHALFALVGVLVLTTCVSTLTRNGGNEPLPDRGIKYSHQQHEELDLGLDCSVCHEFSADAQGRMDMTLPSHPICSVCHDIPEDMTQTENCSLCHTRDDYSIDVRQSLLGSDIKFAHEPHQTEALDCATCHTNPDVQLAPQQGFKPWCMDCHGQASPQLNECSVCHDEIDKDYIPNSRYGTNIAHDNPEIWEKVHGQEFRIDPQYCAMCHDQQQDCDQCHSVHAPDSHTVAFRRKTHGLEARWNQESCAVCHEEDSCIRCHSDTQPTSHRGAFGPPVNAHCASCHFPVNDTSCTVCHDRIDHPTAQPSLHSIGIFPPNCAVCHPGGLPNQAPHIVNSSVRCVVCHR